MIRYFLPAAALFFACNVFAQVPAGSERDSYTLASLRRSPAVQFLMGPYEPLTRKSIPGGNRRHRYEVRLKSDSTFRRAGRIEKYDRGDVFVMGSRHDYDIVKPGNTVSITRIVNSHRTLEGVPHNGGWVFRVVTGTITGYSPYPEETVNRVAYMQLEPNGPIEEADVQRLEVIMEGNEAALALLRKGKVGAAMERYNRDIAARVQRP